MYRYLVLANIYLVISLVLENNTIQPSPKVFDISMHLFVDDTVDYCHAMSVSLVLECLQSALDSIQLDPLQFKLANVDKRKTCCLQTKNKQTHKLLYTAF